MAKIQDVSGIQQIWDNMKDHKKFQMMKIYESIMGSNSRTDWYHLMSHNIARPRAKVILWLAIQDRLATKVRLHRLGLLQDMMCSLCLAADENTTHLLFQCSHTVGIWQALLDWLGIKVDTPIDFHWIKQVTKGKGKHKGLLKATITEIVYGIWMYRNKRIFEGVGTNRDIQHVTKDVIDTIVYRGWLNPTYRKIIVNYLM
ncbi:uncharacterized protein LOC131633001 [Vicia villosa]|uniref:uncharacterized protein LOC131633001 n=1 Tax=Vicia villosa TaxID=3911 RepID=UPI00273B482B|nr:uncharacterized protein LOC131633001 [Vicia villosa]